MTSLSVRPVTFLSVRPVTFLFLSVIYIAYYYSPYYAPAYAPAALLAALTGAAVCFAFALVGPAEYRGCKFRWSPALLRGSVAVLSRARHV